jgi:RNA polymerase sigma-70 factor (ECF subfamily)
MSALMNAGNGRKERNMICIKKIDHDNFINRLKARDERALDYVIDTYGGLIRFIVRRKLPSLSDQWEECENDILLAVWNEIGHYDSTKNSFAGWLAAVCRYKAIDCLRKSVKQRKELPLPSADEELSTGATGAEPVFDCETRDEIMALLKNLPADDRRLFWDCYVRQESVEQLAEKRNIRVSALYNRLSRGRKKLRQYREVKP